MSAEEQERYAECKSRAMEKEFALRMWQLSEERCFRYVTFISDVDSSAFHAVTAMNDGAGPYVNAAVTKEDCVNHIAKRLGTRLCLLKKTTSEEITTSTGKRRKKTVLRGKNKLTDTVIDKLGSYFGKAIRDCSGTSG